MQLFAGELTNQNQEYYKVNDKQYYAMFKITKCEDCVVYLQFALIATSRLKPGKVLKFIFACIKVVPVLHFLCQQK